ncbi:c-type cytochrome [Bacillus lacus]|uniref:C-type cytochrome n=1 Tax=Metabacillus lacus TaxID=1983721 RepID=A0A7X2IX65_9BACI|nr:cytochrome c [Metabacillus lacus]MRX71290.1 c-type cytochrome [Metabacillus lacus]
MNRNPLIPFALIAVLGIGLIFLFSFKGLGDARQLAEGGEEQPAEDVANASPEEIYAQQGCINCHGQNYEGGVGPKLTGVGERLSENDIKNIIQNGGNGMPGNLVPQEKLDEMTAWVAELQ